MSAIMSDLFVGRFVGPHVGRYVDSFVEPKCMGASSADTYDMREVASNWFSNEPCKPNNIHNREAVLEHSANSS